MLDTGGGAATGVVTNPVADTVTSVDRGAVVYDASCARCHGVDALGGGVDSGTTQIRPPNLRSGHLNQHTDADIYRWISNGLTGGMPAWSGTLSETDRWNLVNYLRSINGKGPAVGPSPSISGSGSGAAPLGQGFVLRGGQQQAAGLAVAGGIGSVLLGWLAFGFGRLGRSRRRRPGRSGRVER